MIEKPRILGSSKPTLGTLPVPPAAAMPPPALAPSFVAADPTAPPPPRITFVSRLGKVWSYPYHYISLVECLTPDRLTIHCNCGAVDRIEIRGRCLDQLVGRISAQQLASVVETEHPHFAQDGTIVTKLAIFQAKRTIEEQPNS